MNHLALTMLVSLASMVVAEPEHWVYEKIHLLSDEENSPERVKKFQIPSSNATQQNQTKSNSPQNTTLDTHDKKSNSPQNTTLDTHDKKQDDNQTDAVAKLYSFLKFTSRVKDNTSALNNASSEDSARNSTNPVADTANPEANSTGKATLADDSVSEGTSAVNGGESVAAAFNSQQTSPGTKITGSLTSQTPSAQSHSTSLGIQGVALAGHSRSNVPVRPLGLRANIPQYPNSYLPGHVPVSISQSRSYVATWPWNNVPNSKAVFRALVPVPKSYAAPNRAVLRSPVPGRPMIMPNRAMVRPAVLGQHGYMASHAVSRSPIPGQPQYAVNRAGIRSPILGRATFIPNQATLRHTMNRYVSNRGALRSPIPRPPYTAYLPHARAFNFPKTSFVGNPAKHSYTPYRGPLAVSSHSTQYIPHLPYARRQNIPYSYPFKSSTPFLAPGQKRAYIKANHAGHRSFARVARPAYSRTQVPARPLG